MAFRRPWVGPRRRDGGATRHGGGARPVRVLLDGVTAAFPLEPDLHRPVYEASDVSGARARVAFGGSQYVLDRYSSSRWPRDGDASVALDAFTDWVTCASATTLLHYRRRVQSFWPPSMLVDAPGVRGGIVGQLLWHRGNLYAAYARYAWPAGRLAAVAFALSVRTA